jgi:hypothetical protein
VCGQPASTMLLRLLSIITRSRLSVDEFVARYANAATPRCKCGRLERSGGMACGSWGRST